MGEEPTWVELVFGFLLTAAVPTLIGGAVILSVIGLVVWATAPLRGRRRSRSDDEPGPMTHRG